MVAFYYFPLFFSLPGIVPFNEERARKEAVSELSGDDRGTRDISEEGSPDTRRVLPSLFTR